MKLDIRVGKFCSRSVSKSKKASLEDLGGRHKGLKKDFQLAEANLYKDKLDI